MGFSNVGDIARDIVGCLDLCIAAGINHEGINAEVAKGQWEFQIFGKGSKRAADQVHVARYILQRFAANNMVLMLSIIANHSQVTGMDQVSL